MTYNVLLDRYDQMELGDKPTTYTAVLEKMYDSKVAGVEAGLKSIAVDIQTAQQIAINTASADATTKANDAKTQAISNANSYTDGQIASAKTTIQTEYEQAIEDATELIRGGTGGYVVTTVNANGQPIELLITDNLDLSQAVNVWRWNQGGLAHSSNGYAGPFNDVAITADGKINASMILTGVLTANLITAGTITDSSGKNTWNLDSGQFNSEQGNIGGFEITNRGLVKTADITRYNLKRFLLNTATTGSLAQADLFMALTGIGYSSGVGVRLGTDGVGFLYSTDVNAVDNPVHDDISNLFRLYLGTSDNYPKLNLFEYGAGTNGTAVELFAVQDVTTNPLRIYRDVRVNGSLSVTGTKPRLIKTPNYGERLNYCYETPTPLFGDIGEAQLDADGICYVDIDDIFSETIELRQEYQVFLQKEGKGDCWIAEKHPRYFVIKGTPNLKVAWELKAKQRDYDMIRLEQPENGLNEYEYAMGEDTLLNSYINEQEELLYGND